MLVIIPDSDDATGGLMAAAFMEARRAESAADLDRLARFAASLLHAAKTERQKRARECEAA